MDSDFIPLPDEIDTLKIQLAEKEKIINELLLENLSLKNLNPSDSIEELDVELREDAETIELKRFDDENEEDDDGEMMANLGENMNQDAFLNILKMLMSQGTYGHQNSEGIPDPNPSLNSDAKDRQEEGHQLERGDQDEDQEEEQDEDQRGHQEEEQDREQEVDQDEDIIDNLPLD
jgi:hypothetical protein